MKKMGRRKEMAEMQRGIRVESEPSDGAGKRVKTSFARAYFNAPSARTDRSPLSHSQYTPRR